jgi:long-subunit acyl-CoA synthetase (AMP-forming)
VVPGPLEALLCKSIYISQAYVGGDNKEHTIALLVPEPQQTAVWCMKNKIIATVEEFQPLVHLKDSKVVEHFRSEVEPAFR